MQGRQAAGHNVRLMHLNDLAFDMDYERAGYRDPKPLEDPPGPGVAYAELLDCGVAS